MIITVRGIPAPKGSKRFFKNGGMIEMSKGLPAWTEAVRSNTERAMTGQTPFSGPVIVTAAFWMPRPKGHYRTGRNAHLLRDSAPQWPTGKPDLDKLERAVLDALTAGGAWHDDAQVVRVTKHKHYAANDTMPGCTIEIFDMNGEA
jgi:crossover junction endodeoxyribonuclease RusA